jgi:acyl-CoA reductase-like NAD-dependent aldehyde dehydrogenase
LTALREQELPARTAFESFINGKPVGADREERELFHPATGVAWGTVKIADEGDVADAVASAKRAFKSSGWATMSQPERSDALRRLAGLAELHSDEFAHYELLATGKTLQVTAWEGEGLAQWLRFYAGVAEAAAGGALELTAQATAAIIAEPVGVVAAITPFNGALSLGSWKVAPALAVGNSVVLKPPVDAPASSMLLAELAHEAGLPPGTLNVIPGEAEVGRLLASHPDVALLSFTGSTVAAKELASQTGATLKRFVCEAGGKSAHIVFADADRERACDAVLRGVFGNAGQTCVAGSRALISADIYDDFVAELVVRAKALRIGDPSDPATELGPLAAARHLARVTTMTERAIAEGARCLTGGRRPELGEPLDGGYFFEPTILEPVSLEQEFWREEVFGPVCAVKSFSTEEEAIALANDSSYGLAAGVWTDSPGRAHRMSRALEAGTVWVNTYRYFDHRVPFGGYKSSGLGRENGAQVLSEFTNTKSVITVHGD